MNHDPKFSRRSFLQKAGIGLGAAVVLCSGGAGLALAHPKIEIIETELKGNKEMNKKILVAYASKCGSTSQIAEAIGKTLNELGAMVDVKPVDAVKSLDSYHAVIVGSAIRYGSWLPGAAAFISTHAEALKKLPVAYFTAGSTLFVDTPENRAAAAACTAKQSALVTPAATADFAGCYDPKKVSFAERMLGKAAKMPEGDFRDWDAIRAWAGSLASILF